MRKDEFYSQSKIVDIYDKRRFGGRSGEWVNKREVEIIQKMLPPKGNILDIPSGTGRVAKYLQDKSYKVVCADLSDKMVEKTKKVTKKGTKVIKASADKLPFKNEEFDGVVNIRFLFHFKKIDKFLRESKRVLRKKGVIVFDTYNWSPRAFPFLSNKVFIHKKKDIEYTLKRLDLKVVERVDLFMFSPLIYRHLPWLLVSLLEKIENVWPRYLLVRTFWKARKI